MHKKYVKEINFESNKEHIEDIIEMQCNEKINNYMIILYETKK